MKIDNKEYRYVLYAEYLDYPFIVIKNTYIPYRNVNRTDICMVDKVTDATLFRNAEDANFAKQLVLNKYYPGIEFTCKKVRVVIYEIR